MTDSMVERVARALCAEDGTDPDGLDSQGQVWWTCYEDSARAAIAAMRTPTTEMIEAGESSMVSYDYMRGPSSDPDADAIWTAMIDTALEQRGLEG